MSKKQKLYIGTYTRDVLGGDGCLFHGEGKGIYLCEFDPDSSLLSVGGCEDAENPSFVVTSRKFGALYAVREVSESDLGDGGCVRAYRCTGDEGLTFLGEMPTGGREPCHITVDEDNACLYISNYGSGSLGIVSLKADGSLDRLEQCIRFPGCGADAKRQNQSHIHSSLITDDGLLRVTDLGTDRITEYTRAASSPRLSERHSYRAEAGDGPRMTAGGGRNCFYAVNELSDSVSVFDRTESGAEAPRQKLPTVDGSRENLAAHIAISPDGRRLYVSNRGADTLCCFRICADGSLASEFHVPCGGCFPRFFLLTEDGQHLLCANQNSGDITVFRVDPATGALTSASRCAIPSPVCIAN